MIKVIETNEYRCTFPTKSGKQGLLASIVGQCGRTARISIDDHKLCRQHAGTRALMILIESEGE